MTNVWVSGINLDNWWLTNSSTHRPAASVEQAAVELPGVHGDTPAGLYRFTAPTYKLVFRPAGNNFALEIALDEITGLLSTPGAVLRREVDGLVREAPITLVSIEPDTWKPQRWAEITATVRIHGAFFRDLQHADHAAPIGTTQLDIRGTAPIADAVVRFAGPMTGVARVTDVATQTGVTWEGTLAAGEYVFVNPRLATAHIGAAGAWGAGRAASGGLRPAPEGMLQLVGRNAGPVGPVQHLAGQLWQPAQGMEQDPTTLLWRRTEAPTVVPPSTRKVTVQVSGAPAVIRAKGAWL